MCYNVRKFYIYYHRVAPQQCCSKINYLLNEVSELSGMRLCRTVPNVHGLEQARWSLVNSSHVVMFSPTVKVSKVKAIQHKF